jgi:hypothetical protein
LINDDIKKFQNNLDILLLNDMGAEIEIDDEKTDEPEPTPIVRKSIYVKPNQKEIAKVYR